MKKKTLVLALLPVLFSFISGCGQGEEDPLAITIRDDRQYFIPSTTTSCKNRKTPDAATDDVGAKFFQFRDVTFAWGDTTTNAYISYIQVEFSTSTTGGAITKCKIGGDELLALHSEWFSQAKVPVLGGPAITLPSGSTYTPRASLKIDCPLTCGGLSLSDDPFISYGKIKVVGYKDDGGTIIPISTTTTVTIENK